MKAGKEQQKSIARFLKRIYFRCLISFPEKIWDGFVLAINLYRQLMEHVPVLVDMSGNYQRYSALEKAHVLILTMEAPMEMTEFANATQR